MTDWAPFSIRIDWAETDLRRHPSFSSPTRTLLTASLEALLTMATGEALLTIVPTSVSGGGSCKSGADGATGGAGGGDALTRATVGGLRDAENTGLSLVSLSTLRGIALRGLPPGAGSIVWIARVEPGDRGAGETASPGFGAYAVSVTVVAPSRLSFGPADAGVAVIAAAMRMVEHALLTFLAAIARPPSS